MSAVADFRLIDTSQLIELIEKAEIREEGSFFNKKVTDEYWDYLATRTRKIRGYEGSGYLLANLLDYLLEKRAIDLSKGKYAQAAGEISQKRQNTTFILTFDHAQKYMDSLVPSKFTGAELLEFKAEFSEEEDPDLAQESLACLLTLRENLSLLSDDHKVLLLSIG